jgi:formate dehydrogenase iron-sulfur subunit
MGAMLGHGGIVVADDTPTWPSMARFAMEFCAEESCGKCTPCRIGSTRGVEVIDRMIAAGRTERHEQALLLRDLCDTMQYGSLCAMGGMTPIRCQRAQALPRRFRLTPRRPHSDQSLRPRKSIDLGTPARDSDVQVT